METHQNDTVVRRLPNFAAIEYDVIDDENLTCYDLLVYMAIARHCDRERTAWPSIAKICKNARISRYSVVKALKHLEALKYLVKERYHRPDGGLSSNHYTLGIPSAATICTPRLPHNLGEVAPQPSPRLPHSQEQEPLEQETLKEGKETTATTVAPAPKEDPPEKPDQASESDYRGLHNRIKKAANMTGFSYNPTVAALYRKLDELGILDEGELVALADREDVDGRVSHWITAVRDVLDDGGWPEGEPEQEEPKPRKLSERERLEREATLARLGYVKDKKTGQMVPQYEQEDTGKKKRCKCNTLHENVLFCIQGL